MKTRRWAIAGLALVASFGLATAACGSDSSGDSGDAATSPTPATPTDPKLALTESVKGIAEGNFKFTTTDHESTGGGLVHAPTKSAEMTVESIPGAEAQMTMGFVFIDADRWIKMEFADPTVASLLNLPKGWLHLDSAKIKDKAQLKEMSIDFADPDDVDPLGAAKIFKALLTAEKTGEGAYSGTVDLTRAKDAGMVSEDVVAALKDKAKSIPFTASLDARGRLTRLTLDMPAAGEYKAHKLEAGYSDYGAATSAKKPSDAHEAPASAYEILNA